MKTDTLTTKPETPVGLSSSGLLECVSLACAESICYELGAELNAVRIGRVLEKYLPRWVDKYYEPRTPGWHYVRNEAGSVSARYFDDSDHTWWLSDARNGFTPNDSFAEWLTIPNISPQQRV